MRSKQTVAKWFIDDYRDLNADPEVMASVIVNGVLSQVLARMNERDLSMADVARKLGVSRAAITRLFCAKNPSIKRLTRLAGAVGCVIDVPKVRAADTADDATRHH
ncbi:MAG: helix-turn-helix domain-containing protein [Rhodothermia bacterium]